MHYLIELYHKLFNKHNLQDVFTPGTIAKVNYLRRKDLEKRISVSLGYTWSTNYSLWAFR